MNNLEYISDEENDFLDSDKEHNKYYIGIYKYYSLFNILLFESCVSNKSFFLYKHNDLLDYLMINILAPINITPKIEIMKLNILEDGTYSVVLKTYWIKIIQRHFKKVYKEWQCNIKKMMHLDNINHIQRTGYNKPNIARNIYLKGMLSNYI
jgi:hypothetical protein